MTQAQKLKQDEELQRFAQHKEDLKESAASAVRVIADAALQASKVVSEAAAVSVKVLREKNADDHDLLIKLNTLMDGLKVDIADLKSGTSLKIENHDMRLKALETKTSNYTLTLALYTLLVSGLIGILIYHLIK